MRLGTRHAAALTAAFLLLLQMTPSVFARGAADELRGSFACALAHATGLPPSHATPPQDVRRGTLCAAEITAVVGRGWMPELRGDFLPGGTFTRLQASVALVDALGISPRTDDHRPNVRDAQLIPKPDWGFVNEALGLRLLDVLPGGYFRPGAALTAPMAASALAALHRLAAPGFLLLRYSTGAKAPVPVAGTLQATKGQVLIFSVTSYDLAGGSPSWLVPTYTISGPSGTITGASGTFTAGAIGLFDVRAHVPGYRDASASISVTNPHPTGLGVAAPATGTSGEALTVTLTLEDSTGHPFPYSGQEAIRVSLSGDPTAKVPDTASFTGGVAEVETVPSVGGVWRISVSLQTTEGTLTATSAPVSVAASGNFVSVQSSLSAGGDLVASIPVESSDVAWMLIGQTGMGYPLFGSTASSISQSLPLDIPVGNYILTATDLSTHAQSTYSTAVHITSSWHPPVSSSGRKIIDPFDVYNAQDMIPVLDGGIWGQGETIALYEASSVNPADIEAFDRDYGLPQVSLQVIAPDGPVPLNVATGLASEATMDLEWAHAMAPGAHIVLYEYPQPSAATIAQTASDAQSRGYNVLSFSMGISQDASAQADQAVSTAVQHGLAIFASAGDHGEELPGKTRWPASDAYVVAVGGLQYDQGTVSYWNSNYDANGVLWAGGWGTSDYAAPPWQAALRRAASRILPDVSFLARDAAIVYEGQDTYSGGTSLGSPCWAGIWALSDQEYRSTHNGKGISALPGQVIYNVATDVAAPAAGFFQPAGTAQSFAGTTGFGAPDVRAFVDDVVALY